MPTACHWAYGAREDDDDDDVDDWDWDWDETRRNQGNELHSKGNRHSLTHPPHPIHKDTSIGNAARLKERQRESTLHSTAHLYTHTQFKCYFFKPPTPRDTPVIYRGTFSSPMSRESKMEMRAQKFYCITFAYEWQIRNERRTKCVSFRCQFPEFGVCCYITYTCIRKVSVCCVCSVLFVCVCPIVQNPNRYVSDCAAVWIVHQYNQKVGVVYNCYLWLWVSVCVCLRLSALCVC